MKIEKLLKGNHDLEYVDSGNLGTHPSCDVWFDEQLQEDSVVEMISHVKPSKKVDGAVKHYQRDIDGLVIIKNDVLLTTKWKFGKVRWELI